MDTYLSRISVLVANCCTSVDCLMLKVRELISGNFLSLVSSVRVRMYSARTVHDTQILNRHGDMYVQIRLHQC